MIPSRSDVYVVAVDGLADRPLSSLSPAIVQAAYRAVNRTADRARTSSARAIREQVAFPASYLNPSEERLFVRRRANADNLEATISAQMRPTSLARFATSGTPGKPGVSVTVAPGFAKFMKRAFLIRLRAGNADLDTKNNMGLAIRLKPGEQIRNKKQFRQLSGNLYLLYGPSVAQVFQTVREDVAPEASDFLAAEFARLIDLDLPA